MRLYATLQHVACYVVAFVCSSHKVSEATLEQGSNLNITAGHLLWMSVVSDNLQLYS